MNETGIGNSLTFLCNYLVASLRLAVPLVAALVAEKDNPLSRSIRSSLPETTQ